MKEHWPVLVVIVAFGALIYGALLRHPQPGGTPFAKPINSKSVPTYGAASFGTFNIGAAPGQGVF